ncbi:MAG: CHAT domain-containing protein [Pyrinomonadaceae bacterium]
MEQEFAEPVFDAEESGRLKKYLLGNIKSETERENLEERLMLHADYLEELLRQEEELIQAFADGELTVEEERDFLNHFLITDERREKLNFAQMFKTHLDNQAIVEKKMNLKPEKGKYKKLWHSLFYFPRPIFAVAGLAVIASVSILFWYFYFQQSNRQQALASLNNAYREGRPLESRIANFEYSPFDNLRGETDSKINLTERNLAERILLENATQNATAENLHAIGQLYLAKKELDEAIKQLEKAANIDPQNADILNDLGVAYLEKSRSLEKNNVVRGELTGNALEKFDSALKINSKLTTAYFNKALALQLLDLPNQAREAWTEYLRLDSSSSWAEEARRNLQALDARSAVNYSTEDTQTAFLSFFRAKNDEESWRISQINREIIKEKYLPQKLAISLLEDASNPDNNEFLQALAYLGKLERERTGDSYASDLANYYRQITSAKARRTLKTAQDYVRKGYQSCLAGKFSQAEGEFTQAQNLFLKEGNTAEAVLSQHFIAYCLYNMNQKAKAVSLFQKIDQYTRVRGHKWLYLLNRWWLVGAEEILGYKSSTEVKKEYESILTQAQIIGDSYLIQKTLLFLVLRSHSVNQDEQMMKYMQKLIEVSNTSSASLRQKARNFGQGAEAFSTTKYNSLAKAFILEGLIYEKETGDPQFVVNYEINCGIIHMQANDFDTARKWFLTAENDLANINEKAVRDNLSAKIFLKLGHLERKNNNYREAITNYEKSLQIAGDKATRGFWYEAQKSRLLSFQALGDEDEVERGIYELVNIAENYRREILDEKERDSFFDNEQTVYDIAVEHEIRQGDFQQAFNYAEMSSSRSLLDWLHQGASVLSSQNGLNVIFNNSVKPLDLATVQEKLPSNVQILQYYELDNRIIIWIISKDTFFTAKTEIKITEVNSLITSYLNLLQINKSQEQSSAQALSRRLYQILIQPIAVYLDQSKQICIIPNKKLFVLPFASLTDDSEQYFVTKYVFFYASSANTFILSTENAAKNQLKEDESFLGIGNPDFSPRKFADLADLPDAVSEIKRSSRNYVNRNLLLEKDATKEAFEKLAFAHDIIHFAGHYLVQNGSPLASGLLFSSSENEGGELFTNGELLQIKLPQTRLIIISACQTGVEKYYNGEGLIGLSRTFLATGVPLVIGSQWKVDSKAAAELMTDFHYFRRQEKLSTVAALRKSQLKMIEDAQGGHQTPYFWAAFAVFGGYAEF